MAWALKFDGVDDYADFGAEIPYHTNRTQYRFYAEYIRDNASNIYFVSRHSIFATFESSIRLTSSTVRVRYGGSAVQWSGLSFPQNTDVKTIEITRDGNIHELFLDGVSQGTKSSSVISSGRPVRAIGRASTDVSQFQLIKMELWDSPSGGSLIHNHDATASDHSAGGQPELFDTIGGNNATGVNFPTDGSAWADLGGGTPDLELVVPFVSGSTVVHGVQSVSTELFIEPSVIQEDSEVQSIEVQGQQVVDLEEVQNVEVVSAPEVLVHKILEVPVTNSSTEVLAVQVIQPIDIDLSRIEGNDVVYNLYVLSGDGVIVPSEMKETQRKLCAYLRELGFSGSNNDVVKEWLFTEGYESGAYNDIWFKYLRDQGFEGSINDMKHDWKQQ